MAKTIFVLFQILIPILLLNMLIAMMGNTYAIVIEKSEKEFLKQWAKVIMSIERSIPPSKCKENLESYSIAVRSSFISTNDSSSDVQLGPTERGVMVIKSKDKTRACQRKGALSNWKVGKSDDLSSHLGVAENGKDDHQVLEEARNQRGRSAPRDVGSRRGDDAEGQPQEEGKRLRHLFCPGPRSASSRVSVLLLTIYLSFTLSIIIYVIDSALTRKRCKKWRTYENSSIASN